MSESNASYYVPVQIANADDLETARLALGKLNPNARIAPGDTESLYDISCLTAAQVEGLTRHLVSHGINCEIKKVSYGRGDEVNMRSLSRPAPQPAASTQPAVGLTLPAATPFPA